MNAKGSGETSREPRVEVPGAAHLVLAEGVAPLHPEEAVFEAMLEGWRVQQQSRYLKASTIEDGLAVVRRFAGFTNEYPWRWTPADVEEWTSVMVSAPRPLAHSTVRSYQQALARFLGYATDRRYGWGAACEERFDRAPVQVCHEWNTVAHRADYEGRPGNRPFTREELQRFFDFCDGQVERARRLGRKGWTAAFRDATLFKVAYAWGLRRRETARLDVADFTRNPAASEFGGFGMLSVRWGKAGRGGPPRRRNVCTVFGWSAEAVAQYVAEVRPLYGNDAHPALWLTERGGRVSSDYINLRFREYRDAAGLAEELGPHCLRHAYVTHLIEEGFDALFVQQQVGHAWASTTALYTGVSGDFKNRVLRAALDRAFAQDGWER
jgi:site-specific recombinase XerD